MAHKSSKRSILKKYVGTGGPGRNRGIPEFVDTTYLKGNGKGKAEEQAPVLPKRISGDGVKAKPVEFDQVMKAPAVMPKVQGDPTRKKEAGGYVSDDYLKAQKFIDRRMAGEDVKMPFTPGTQGPDMQQPAPMTAGYSQSTPMTTAPTPAAMFNPMRKSPDQAQAQASPMFQQKRKMLRNKLSQLTGIPAMK